MQRSLKLVIRLESEQHYLQVELEAGQQPTKPALESGLLISIIAVDSDTIGRYFLVSLSVSPILLCGSISVSAILFRLYRYRLSAIQESIAKKNNITTSH
jgi:hypothetical protein